MSKKNLRGQGLHRNTVSYLGMIVMAISVVLILATLLWSVALRSPSPYLGIFTFLVFPTFFFLGLLVFLWGTRRESQRRKRVGSDEALPYPSLDLNDSRQRKVFAYVAMGGALLLILNAFLGYHGFLFTESVTFCGKVCHTVMEPEYTAYQNSPHARVTCVHCHVGEGVDWYVKSKLSGLRQVWAVVSDSYDRPIPCPIENLRPARETCEECHWPAKFFGSQLMQLPHFRYDEQNTAEQVSLLIKTGGGSGLTAASGIHWHMLLEGTITFATDDTSLHTIPVCEVRHPNGEIAVYRDPDSQLSKEAMDRLPRHTMDCIGCHNRPTHIFPLPDQAVDQALLAGRIPKDLPWIKKVAVEALVQPYASSDAARAGIRESIQSFYREEYPDLARERSESMDQAASAVGDLFARSVFPAMNVNWKTYASHIGHRNWPGCFRCHDNRHVSEAGEVLSNACDLCHSLPVRSELLPLGEMASDSDKPWHPIELTGKHASILCSRCHEAGYRPTMDCARCHQLNLDAPMMDMGCHSCHTQPGSIEPMIGCTECHEASKGLHAEGAHPDAGCNNCHGPHAFNTYNRDMCLECHDDRVDHHSDESCHTCHEFTD